MGYILFIDGSIVNFNRNEDRFFGYLQKCRNYSITYMVSVYSRKFFGDVLFHQYQLLQQHNIKETAFQRVGLL